MSTIVGTPTSSISKQIIGNTTIVNPILLLVVNSVIYSNGYWINYSNKAFRNIYPTYDPATGNILIVTHCIAAGLDIPAITLYNVGVHIIG